jgi:hypothetical protein
VTVARALSAGPAIVAQIRASGFARDKLNASHLLLLVHRLRVGESYIVLPTVPLKGGRSEVPFEFVVCGDIAAVCNGAPELVWVRALELFA